MSHFRRISCCNVLYKIVSKIMANKLKVFLDDLISINQSAFVPGRLIMDNALIAFEIFHYMKRKGEGRDGSVALKLDMSKAYDRVEWGFLERVMLRLGFSGSWVQQVMACISSVSFSVKKNGSICGNISPSRGFRQGDPIHLIYSCCVQMCFLCSWLVLHVIRKFMVQKSVMGLRGCLTFFSLTIVSFLVKLLFESAQRLLISSGYTKEHLARKLI